MDKFVLPGGTFKVTHSNPSGPQTFNPKTCLLLVSGHGKYTLSIVSVGAKTKKGACSQTAAPVAFQQLIDATGAITLP